MKRKNKVLEGFWSGMSSSKSTKPDVITNLRVPTGISITESQKIVTVKGKLGNISKDFTKLPATLSVEGDNLTIKPYGHRKKDLAIANTAKSIITNMIKGVNEGFEYKLKIIYAHFPIAVKVKDNLVLVENFFGERSARISRIHGGSTKVIVQGDDVVVSGPNLEEVSQTAADIEASTKVKNKDRRVFLDGLYIYHKGK
jgi:large subunit ribosomal protein L6